MCLLEKYQIGTKFGSTKCPYLNWKIMPITHLTRYMLQYADTIKDVDKILSEQDAFSFKLLFVASNESAAVFEIANDEKARMDTENSFLAFTLFKRKWTKPVESLIGWASQNCLSPTKQTLLAVSSRASVPILVTTGSKLVKDNRESFALRPLSFNTPV